MEFMIQWDRPGWQALNVTAVGGQLVGWSFGTAPKYGGKVVHSKQWKSKSKEYGSSAGSKSI